LITLADSLISTTSRPLKLRMRPDLVARRHKYHGQTFWVVKEPVGLNYFRFHEEEYEILCMLDGHTSLDQIKEDFERQFTPQKITFQDLLQFVGMLHRSGLVISESPGQGQQLVKRRNDRKQRELLGKLSNVFALRFRGVDPERFLNWLYKYTWWLFTPPAITVALMFGLSALLLVFIQFDVFRHRLPAFHEFFSFRNWIFLGITMAVVKILHEFGHGLSCKHFGGECHELGAMLLVFTPALYCNVSDSWMLPNKYQRAFIGAAGMYVELILASIATYVWWFSEPGLVNHIALSVMFICSVSTVMFNGNPLLRFDGYYITMDLLEIPNLQQKSSEILKRFWMQYCLGVEQPENPFLPQRNQELFALYTIAAVCYRWFVTFSILYFLNKVFEPYGLKPLGQLIAMAGLVGLVLQPAWQLYKFVYTPGRMSKVKSKNVTITIAVIATLLAAFLFVPAPFAVKCAFEVQPHEAAGVYVSAPGTLAEVHVKPYQEVKAGDVIAVLENRTLKREYEDLLARRDETRDKLLQLQLGQVHDASLGAQIPATQELLQSAEEQLRNKEEELGRLTITAPRDGFVLEPPPKSDKGADSEGRLKSWTGTPFEPRNLGAMLQPPDLFCFIGRPEDLDAALVLNQADMDLVSEGQEVRILLDAYTGKAYSSKVDELARSEMKFISPTLAVQSGGRQDTRTDASGMHRPLNTSYAARARLENCPETMQIGLQGQARIYTGWQPLAMRAWRFLSRTFHFDL
jgi:putative peptide zinc metalloprotease protein